ncbi:MAG TPA: oxidoreductase [Nocardioides sp.]|uniref:oxidoreductase n=1 Tax=Nocardioides sp. TaxID=35761 RepID=UPI002C72F9CB|nr:oxidoreductase [Nocardioides sp.]HTW15417.1 oxidoreductase [Nocardioides sp.]
MSGLPTAAEVLDGVDLAGRTALVTGGYSGIGVEVVRALAGAGATVLVPARRPSVASAAVAEIEGVEVGALDLADQASVASYAGALVAAGRPIDVVIGNAGVMACPETRVGPGWELQLATNHLGHFALVNRLAPLLGSESRVVSVSSTGHHLSGIRWDDPLFSEPGSYDKWLAYGQSKTANVLFAVHLATLGVRAYSLHPGAILTPLGRHLQESDLDAVMTLDADGRPVLPDFRSPEQGAATAVWAATAPDLVEHAGAYLEDCGLAPVVPPGPQTTYGVKDYALDPDDAARLWAWSVEQTGVDGFG